MAEEGKVTVATKIERGDKDIWIINIKVPGIHGGSGITKEASSDAEKDEIVKFWEEEAQK
jgi:hypothetical protein